MCKNDKKNKKKGTEIKINNEKDNIIILSTKRASIPDIGCNIITYVDINMMTCENINIYLPKDITSIIILMKEINKSDCDLLMLRIINLFKNRIWTILLMVYIKIKGNDEINILKICFEANKSKENESFNSDNREDDDNDDNDENINNNEGSNIFEYGQIKDITETELNYIKKISINFVNYMIERYNLENETEILCFIKRESELNIFIKSLGININENIKQKIEELKMEMLEEIFENNNKILQLVEILHIMNTKKMAMKMGMSKKIITKIDIYGEFILYANNRGHSCLKKNTLETLCFDKILKKKSSYEQNVVDELINDDNILSKYIKNNEIWYYDKNNYEAEIKIVEFIRNKLKQKSELDTIILKMKDMSGLNELQRDAIKMIFKNKISILTGFPGTGKTYVISEMLKILKENIQNINIVGVFAPTGKAVNKLRETIGKNDMNIEDIRTLHSQLYKTKIKKEIIIIDEISMVSNDVFYRFIKKLKKKCHVVLVGDQNQLPSVEKGYILDQMIGIKEIPNIHLTKLMRSDINSINLNISLNDILEGKIPSKIHGKGFTWYKDVDRIDDIILALTNKYTNIDEIMFITPFNNEVNKYQSIIKNIYNPTSTSEKKIQNDHDFNIGDLVIQNKNMKYDPINNEMIYNGTMGTVIAVSKYNVTVNFKLDEYHNIDLIYGTNNYHDIGNISHRYILTIHKQQGSEAPIVIIYIPPNYNSLILTRNLLYTGISRAKQKCILIADELTIQNCVKRKCFRHSNIMNMFYDENI